MNNLICERHAQIIKSIISMEAVTLKELKYICNVSERTISKDLNIIESFVKQYGLELIRKPGRGIWIKGSNKAKQKLFIDVNVSGSQILGTPKERQRYILLKLLLSSDYTTLEELYDGVYVSRGTMENDMGKIEEKLNQEGLSIKRMGSKGIKIIGDEKKVRFIITQFFMETAYIMPSREFIQYVNNKQYVKINDHAAERNFFNLFADMDLKKIQKIIIDGEESLGYEFSDMAFTSLLINIAITVIRVKTGNLIYYSADNIKRLKTERAFLVASNMATNLEQAFHIRMTENERAHIAVSILCSEPHYNFLNKKTVYIHAIEPANDVVELCINMIQRASDALDIDFNGDNILLKGLSLHMAVVLNRLFYHMPVKNPMLSNIKSLYITSFQAAFAASQAIKMKYGLDVSESEVAYIALYFEAALERIRSSGSVKMKLLIVCSLGIGTSQLIASKLKRIFDNIEIIDIISSKNIIEYPLQDVDLIITTIPLDITTIPLIRVNPILSQEDVETIRKFLLSNKSNLTRKNIFLGNKFDLIDRDLIFIKKDFSNREHLIKYVTSLMEIKGYVQKDYYDSVLKRENIASTSAGRVALPHGDIKKVHKSIISICTLDKRLDWGSCKVELVILLAIKKEDVLKMQNILDIIYDNISDNKTVNKIVACENAEEMLNIIFGD